MSGCVRTVRGKDTLAMTFRNQILTPPMRSAIKADMNSLFIDQILESNQYKSDNSPVTASPSITIRTSLEEALRKELLMKVFIQEINKQLFKI